MRAPENYGVWGGMTAHERASHRGYNSPSRTARNSAAGRVIKSRRKN